MAMRVFLDAETLPPEREDPLVREKYPGCEDEEFRTLALNPEYGRLLCVGLVIERDGVVTTRGVLGRDRETRRFHLDEARTLRAFWKLVSAFDARRDLMIGFNLLDFDLHYICTRSVIRRVRPSIDVCFARFRSRPIFDVMWEFTHWRKRISLNDVSEVLGLESSKRDGVNGSKVYDLFTEGRHEEIADYCMRDVELTRAVYYRLNFIEESVGGGPGNEPIK
jgi:hypothetical protein